MNRKVVLVTGASSGIGAAIAGRLAEAGYRVFGTSRRAGSPERRGFEMLSLDVTSDRLVEAAVEEVVRRAGRIDVLVNNAGSRQASIQWKVTVPAAWLRIGVSTKVRFWERGIIGEAEVVSVLGA